MPAASQVVGAADKTAFGKPTHNVVLAFLLTALLLEAIPQHSFQEMESLLEAARSPKAWSQRTRRVKRQPFVARWSF